MYISTTNICPSTIVQKQPSRYIHRMANSRFLGFVMMMVVICLLIEQSHEVYVDCQARCMLRSRGERNRETLQKCRDECELIELLEQEDARDGKRYRYRQYN